MAFPILLGLPNEIPLEFATSVTQRGRYQNGGEIHSYILAPPDRNWNYISLCHPAVLEVGVRFFVVDPSFYLLGLLLIQFK
jgi:hypothetical protein